MMKRKSQGDILLQAILIVGVIFTLVFSIAGLVTSQINWINHNDNQLRAQLAARSVLDEAIGELRADQEFTGDIIFNEEDIGLDEKAFLTFEPGKGVPWSRDSSWSRDSRWSGDAPWSTNNTRNSLAVEAWDGPEPLSDGRVIPSAVHLVALGVCRNAHYVAEAEILFPAYPYALASSGPVVADGRLEVFGVKGLADAETTHPDDRLESHIISNSSDSSSIVLSIGEVSGDLISMGGIQATGATVDGDILDNQTDEADLPKLGLERPSGSDSATDKTIYLSDYDFTKNAVLGADADRNLIMNKVDAEADPGVFDVAGLRVRVNAGGPTAAPIELNRGVLLEDATLFVDGNLIIRNGVTGRGAILATGKITIHGPSHLASDQVALFSGGGVNINGQGSSKFRGLVATMSDFEADNVQVAGTFLSVSPEDTTTQIGNPPGMTLDNVTTVHAPDAAAMDIVIHVELKATLEGGFGQLDTNQIGLLHNGTFYTFTGDPSLSQAEKEAQIQATYQALLGVQGEEHPMVDGQVVLRTASGDYQNVEELSGSARISAENHQVNWGTYIEKLPKSEVKIVEIFSIDLNRFTSGSSRIKVLTYR